VNGYPLGDARTHLDASETRAYRRALAAFPTAAACLKDGSDPVTATLNLEAFSNLEELEVCLFLTADTLRDLEGMRALLERSGFKTYDKTIPYSSDRMASRGVIGAGLAVSASAPATDVPIGFVGWLDRLFFAYGLSVNVLFGPTSEPVSASASVNRL